MTVTIKKKKDISPEDKLQQLLSSLLGPVKGGKVYQSGIRIEDTAARINFYQALIQDLTAPSEDTSYAALRKTIKWKTTPVSVKECITSPYFLNKASEVYLEIMPYIEEINSGKYVEVVLTGGIGSGKTTIALYTNAYQLYLLSCMRNPHEEFGMDSSHEIEFIFQSITATLARGVAFMRFKSMIQESPYFKDEFPFDKGIESELRFPNRIIIKPVSGSATAAIGQNVIGGLIDELNYMSVTENSKSSVDGGTYDQAIEIYNSIARRRKTRFMRQGRMPGILCLVSSKRYPGQFTDLKEEERKKEIARAGKSSIYVYDKRVWDIKPNEFTGGWFAIFIGDESRRPRILDGGEEVHPEDRDLVHMIPEDFRGDFETDIINALRELAGVSTLARFPFIMHTESVAECMYEDMESIFTRDAVDFKDTTLGLWPDNIKDPEEPRFVHIDLAKSRDSAGMAIGYVKKFVSIDRGDVSEMLPKIHIDGALEIMPPKGGEIIFYKIRAILYKLRDLGMNIQWVTFDQYQSTDSQQTLRRKGFRTGEQSIDTRTTPYDFTKNALYDERIKMPHHKKLRTELITLELDPKTGKIDHPPAGCSIGSTEILLSDGTVKTIEQMTSDWNQGITHQVYTYKESTQTFHTALAEKPHITKYVTDLIEIDLDGTVVQYTPEHKFLVGGKGWVKAQYLQENDEIISLHS